MKKVNTDMINVLLVEDEELIRQGMRYTIPWDQYGCEVIGEAKDGAEGIEKILELKPDIVITDVKMPKMDGLTMIEQVREQVSCEYIILSGYDEFAYAKKAMHLEAHGYLLKPVDDDELEEVLKLTIHRIEEKRLVYQSFSEKKISELNGDYADMGNIQDKYLERALHVMKDHYQENLTLKSVADELYISESYLGKLFKNKMNYTFLEMLTLYRIRAAVQLLQEVDQKVYEIAYKVGYSDTKYFSKVFKKITGVKPMEIKNGYALPTEHILNKI